MLISRATRRFGGVVLLARCLLLSALILPSTQARSEGCPTAKDEIATDRPDVTNSSLVVPTGSLQNENGVNFSMRDDGRAIDGTNSRWRLGIAPCLEDLVDLPAYFANVQEPGNSGSRMCLRPLNGRSARYLGKSICRRCSAWDCRPARSRSPAAACSPMCSSRGRGSCMMAGA